MTDVTRSWISLLPKEHGAYGQMALPLATSLVVAGPSWSGLLTALAVMAGFAGHEPLLVLLGRRGVRLRRERWAEARRWLLASATTGMAAAIGGVWLAHPSIRPWFLLPLAPLAVIAEAIAENREKSVSGEVAVALAFSLTAVPVCLAGGTPVEVALAVGVTFAAVFVTGTMAVRMVILAPREPRAARTIRNGVFVSTLGVTIALSGAASRNHLPWSALIAAAPGLAGAAWLAALPPSPARLTSVGWTLVMTSSAAALILIAGLGVAR